MNHIDFVILNSYVTVIYLRFIKNTYLLVVKNKKKIKTSVFFPTIYCISLSSAKRIETIICRKTSKYILPFDEESKRFFSRQFY